MSCTQAGLSTPRLLGTCVLCRRNRFTNEDASLVRITEDLEKENIRLKQRLLIIEEALISVRKQEKNSRDAHSERIRIAAIEERQWKLDKQSREAWQMEGKVRIKELEGEIREEIDKMMEEKERGVWGEGISRGLGLAYEMGMEGEKGEGLTLTVMLMRGKIREGDGLCYKRGTTGKVVIGGEDLDDVSAGVESEGDVYESMELGSRRRIGKE